MTTMPVTIQERIPLPSAPVGRPGMPPASGLTAGDVLRILKQRVFLIMAIWILLSGAAVALTYYLLRYHPRYTARTQIQVISPMPKTPMVLGEGHLASGELISRYVSDQAVMMKDEIILREALGDPAVVATEWYRTQKDKVLALQTLKDDLSAAQIPGSSYLGVSFSSGSARDSAMIVNTVVDKYMARVQAAPQLEYAEELKEYVEQEKRLEDALKEMRREKERFLQEKLGTPGLSLGVNVVGETLAALAAAITRVDQEKLRAKAIYENLSQADAARLAISPDILRAIRQDPEVAVLQQNRVALSQELQNLSQELGPNNRAVEAMRSRLANLEQTLTEVMAQKEQEVREYQITAAHTAMLNAMHEELALREQMVEVEAKQRDLEQGMLQFQSMDERQKLIERQLEQYRDHISRLQLLIKDRNPVRVRRAGLATPPDEVSFPKPGIMIPAGSLLALLLGIGLAVLLELVDTSIKTPRDIARHARIPILGQVPDLDDEEVPIEKIELAAHTTPRSMIAEAFRTIRTNLLLSAPAERQRVILVTSSKAEEGKTTVAANLAISIGQSGRRVLLVDANFHRPALQQLFPNLRREGLSNALIGQGKLEELVSRTALPNVDVLTSGPIPPNPTELLASSYLRDVLAQAADRYDQVILDGPPLLLVSDGLVLTGSVDGVILVCRAKITSRGVVQRAREQLERVNGRLFGAVLNAVQTRRGGYYREQIRSYYEYQPEEALVSGTKALPTEEDKPKA